MVAVSLLLPLGLALLVVLPAGRARWLLLAPLAPVPALMIALAVPAGLTQDVPWLLLGARLGLDETGRFFLLFTALVWFAAGLYARGYLCADPRKHVFWAFFLVTQAGNLGVCLALDAASFYLFFALMTFAAYGLVVHNRSAEAWRAGRVYLIMAMLGEVCLAAGLMLAVQAAGSLLIADLAVSPSPVGAVALLIAGFGIKAGLPLLHLWLPLAHPVAPVPASAVLSGVMLKAGLLGWLRFLPLGTAGYADEGAVLMTLGFVAMFFGVAVGLAQRDIKVLLAYSSVSQMGYLALGVGAGLTAPSIWPVVLPAVTLYALHHALAKSALFLGAGVISARGGRPWVLAGLALPALALAGAPLTSGWLSKLALKAALAGLPAPWDTGVAWLLPLAAVATALLMMRLFLLAARTPGRGGGAGVTVPWALWLATGTLLPWMLDRPDSAAGLGDPGTLLSAAWPFALALVLAGLVVRARVRAPSIPPGDVLVWLERLAARTMRLYLRRRLVEERR